MLKTSIVIFLKAIFVSYCMEIKIINKKEDTLELEIIDADHDFLGLIESELNQNSKVLVATYKKSHPEFHRYEFLIKTKGADPVEAFNKAIKSAVKTIESVTKEIVSQL